MPIVFKTGTLTISKMEDKTTKKDDGDVTSYQKITIESLDTTITMKMDKLPEGLTAGSKVIVSFENPQTVLDVEVPETPVDPPEE